MQFTPDSRSNHLTLDEVMARLAASPRVDGLALFGSRAGGEASDYDLQILVDRLPVEIFQMLTHINGRLADVVFVTIALVDRLLADTPAVLDGPNESRFLRRMETAEITYDESGRLARAQAYARQNQSAVPSTHATAYSAWFWQNHSLLHVRRMASSSDPIRLTAVDLMLSTGLTEACRNYCRLRGIAWQGEKAALRHLHTHDPAYLALLRECLAETSRPRRVQLYEQLVVATLQPTGEIWKPGLTSIALDTLDYSASELDAALDFWEGFFA